MKDDLQYRHIIDLEYFFHQDRNINPEELHKRDRNLFLQQRAEQDQARPDQEPRQLILWWLKTRNRSEFRATNQRSPGTIFSDTLILAGNLFFLKGLLVGIIAGLTFFSYSGTTPVNVFHFLLIFVLPQVALVILLVGIMLYRFFRPKEAIPSFYTLLVRKLVQNLLNRVHKKWQRTVTADKRASINHAFSSFKISNRKYGTLFYRPLFKLSQLFGVAFNIGLLATTLLKILSSDLAFGWQSTMQFSTTALLQGIQYIALPWSWLIPQASGGYPSLAEIEGSRIILKDGIRHLVTGNLIAWWPFLVLCLFAYGFLLRAAILLLATVLERRALNNLRLDTPDCKALLRRITTPLVSTLGDKEMGKGQHKQNVLRQPRVKNDIPRSAPQIMLIPDDIFDQFHREDPTPFLQTRGLTVKESHKFMTGYETDKELLKHLEERNWSEEEEIFILMEGWMPPLMDFLSFLGRLRALLPRHTIINLGLIGRPQDTVFTPLQPTDFGVWQQKITALSDPYLSLFPLVSEQIIP